MIDLYISRHGITVWNTQIRMQGTQNSPLTEEGIKGARELNIAIQKQAQIDGHTPDLCLCSPLPRTLHTAHLALEDEDGISRIPIIPEPLLREMDLGSWEGMERDYVKECWPEDFDNFRNHPDRFKPIADGETFYDVMDRASILIEKLRIKYLGTSGHSVMLVSHMILVQAILCICQNRSLSTMRDFREVDQAKLFKIRVYDTPGKFDVLMINGKPCK